MSAVIGARKVAWLRTHRELRRLGEISRTVDRQIRRGRHHAVGQVHINARTAGDVKVAADRGTGRGQVQRAGINRDRRDDALAGKISLAGDIHRTQVEQVAGDFAARPVQRGKVGGVDGRAGFAADLACLLVDLEGRSLVAGIDQDRGAVGTDQTPVDNAARARLRVLGKGCPSQMDSHRIGAVGFNRAGVEQVIEGAGVELYGPGHATVDRHHTAVFYTQVTGVGFNFNAQRLFTRDADGAGVEDFAADGHRHVVMGVQDQAVAVDGSDINQAGVDHVTADGRAIEVHALAVTVRPRHVNGDDSSGVDHAAADVRGAHLKTFGPGLVGEPDRTGLDDITGDRAATGTQIRVQRAIHHKTTDVEATAIDVVVGAVDQRTLNTGLGNTGPIDITLGSHHIARPDQGDRLVEHLAFPLVLAAAHVEFHRSNMRGACADHQGQQGFLERLTLHFKLHELQSKPPIRPAAVGVLSEGSDDPNAFPQGALLNCRREQSHRSRWWQTRDWGGEVHINP